MAVVEAKDGLIVSPSKSMKYLCCHNDIDAWQGGVQNTQPHCVCRSPQGSVTYRKERKQDFNKRLMHPHLDMAKI